VNITFEQKMMVVIALVYSFIFIMDFLAILLFLVCLRVDIDVAMFICVQ